MDELFDDWSVTYVTPDTELAKLLPAYSRLTLKKGNSDGHVRVSLASASAGDAERVDWDCEYRRQPGKGMQISFLTGRFSPEQDPHEHEITIVCMHYPPGGRRKGQMMGYVWHSNPKIGHLTGGWHAEH
jgi:hypothetical protein